MAQVQYRGNLSAKVFPFLSTQFGPSVIGAGADQANTLGESSGDSNVPQAIYMHNVMPTPNGYKSVGYVDIIPAAGIKFDRVIPVRDPDMLRGLIGITLEGSIYIYRAGDSKWTNITTLVNGWLGGTVSVAYANGYTYLCVPGKGVYKVSVGTRSVAFTTLNGVDSAGIIAITSSANYLVITDGLTLYWSSTISPEDFTPSQITGAGSGKPTDLEGRIVALVPLNNGFAIYSAVNTVIASYSQNARYPWVFKGAANSKGIQDPQHVTYSGEDGTNYAWTSAGLQRISLTGAVTYLPELTDFIANRKVETWDTASNSFITDTSVQPLRVKLAFVGGRFLVISYGILSLTHALIYDTAIKRWGKIKSTHGACFDLSLNSDSISTSSLSASVKKTLGLVRADGSVSVCDLDNLSGSDESVIILGKFQLLRSRLFTMAAVTFEGSESFANSSLSIATSLDGKTISQISNPAISLEAQGIKEYRTRVTGTNHSLILKGVFSISAFELAGHINGRR